MDPLIGIGISVGILAGIWGQFSGDLGFITWVGFIAWACFYAAGGQRAGFIKTVPANLSGVLWGWLMVWFAGVLGFTGGLGIAIGIGAFMMVVQAKISWLGFIPGAFAGTSCYFGTNGDWKGTAIALVVGAAFGWASEAGGGLISKIGAKPATADTSVTAA
jgi:Protein of unknown function (DUF1097)